MLCYLEMLTDNFASASPRETLRFSGDKMYAPLSKYTMKVLMDYSTEDSEGASYENEESQESLIWTLFVNILKIILEILL